MAAAKVAKMKKHLSASLSEFLSIGRKQMPVNDNDKNALHSIHQAALIGNLGLMQLLIESGIEVNSFDDKGMTPLHYAVLHNSADCSSLLLEHGAKIDIGNKEGNTAFHIACQYGQQETIILFLQYCHGDIKLINKNGFTPFDLACEHGRTKVVILLLEWGYYKINNAESPIGLHLAAKNGHVETIRTLLDYGFDINCSTYFGTSLHFAVSNGKFDAVRLLLQNGADPYAVNANGQTAYEIARRKSRGKDTRFFQIKQILKEAQQAVYGKAICDYTARFDGELSFNYGDIIWIVERNSNESSWKGVIFGPKCSSRIGRFQASAVQLVDRKVGMQRSASQRRAKKVCIPVVPDVAGLTNSSGMMNADCQKTPATPPFVQISPYNSWVSSFGSEIADQNAVCNSLAQTSQLNDNLALTGCKAQSVIFTGTTTMDGGCGGGCSSRPLVNHQQLQHQNGSGLAGNGPCSSSLLLSSPLRHRNSTGSTSSRSSSGFESMKSGSQQYSHTIIHALRGDSPPSRNSVHSSGSSSLGSLERLDESTCSTSQANIAEMILNGIPDHEIISAWLHDLHYEEYVQLFLNAGYDLATVARMTPEDLTAIGITKPGHRKRLTTEIHKMNVIDNWPDKKPDTVDEWLSALRLNEYTPLLISQGYTLMDKVMQLTWEDFEDIGVKKLGHLKKLVCALKKMTTSADSRSHQLQQQHKKSSGFGGYGEVLVINVPPAQRSLSDVSRPFITQNERQNSHSPQTMSTFQQSSKLTSSQEFLANSSRSPTPCRSPYIAPFNAVQANGNYAYITVPECSNINSNNYDTFPPWRERTLNVAPGALQRLHSVGNDCEPSCSSASQGDFGTGVQLRPLIKIVAKTRRNSRESGATATDQTIIDNNGGEQFASASCESLLRKSFHQDTDSPTRHPFLQHQHNSTESRYPYVDLCTRSVMTYDERQSSPQLCSPRSYSNGSLPICGNSSLVLSNLSSPKNGPQNGTVRNGNSPETATPPKKPPPPKSNIFQLSSAEPTQFDDSCSSSELSPAQSVDEFPPPPFPITCEEQIRNLRSIRGNALMRQPTSVTGMEMNDALMKLGASSDIALQKQDKLMAKQNRNDSTASVDSNSSTETLPFAQENVGTIKQKTTLIGNGAGPVRPHVGDVFGRPESERPDFQASKPATGTNSDGLSAKPGNVLNDIGHMLQDLTDQLDALLCEPASNTPATKVN